MIHLTQEDKRALQSCAARPTKLASDMALRLHSADLVYPVDAHRYEATELGIATLQFAERGVEA